MHLLVDISAHGLGHLAQTGPVLDALRHLLPGLRLTVRSALPGRRLAARIEGEFIHVAEARDFGLVMHNAIDVDRAASASRYREFHRDWSLRVADEATWLRQHGVDGVVCNAAYLPLAAARSANIPAVGMSSLNWGDLFAHYLGREEGADVVHQQIMDAYNAARCFLCFAPGLPMDGFVHRRALPPVRRSSVRDREWFATTLGLDAGKRWILVAMGSMDFPIDFARWPQRVNSLWLVPGVLAHGRDDVRPFDAAEQRFGDLLASVDLVITKPGYGTFVEAAGAGTPILYVERPDWPETPYFRAWLEAHARAAEIGREQLLAGEVGDAIDALLERPLPACPAMDGAAEAARILAGCFHP